MNIPDDIPSWASLGLPSPSDTLEDAAQESEEVNPGEYMSTILTLRDKGFSWRRIAQWFKQRGFNFSHVALYRAYQEHNELQAADASGREDDEEIEP